MNHARTFQAGQAMAEGLLVLSGLAALWMAVSWLYRVQDIALSAQHASSYLAFAATRRDGELGRLHERFFTGPEHRWNDRSGRPMLADIDTQIGSRVFRSEPLPPFAQPGAATAFAALRQDWRLEDLGVLHAGLAVTPGAAHWGAPGHASGAAWSPMLRRHTAILTGAGHAGDDQQTQHVLVQSGMAWRHGADVSYSLSERIRAAMGPVDSGWGRSLPAREWGSAWAGLAPATHLRPAKE
ncbi:MAG: hypothetical protein OZ927_06660 [Alcaligenaceae bacterium]|nr:hypothetical protein [Alcaligenaceae bacterium]